jgi:hypothetical protein
VAGEASHRRAFRVHLVVEIDDSIRATRVRLGHEPAVTLSSKDSAAITERLSGWITEAAVYSCDVLAALEGVALCAQAVTDEANARAREAECIAGALRAQLRALGIKADA